MDRNPCCRTLLAALRPRPRPVGCGRLWLAPASFTAARGWALLRMGVRVDGAHIAFVEYNNLVHVEYRTRSRNVRRQPALQLGRLRVDYDRARDGDRHRIPPPTRRSRPRDERWLVRVHLCHLRHRLGWSCRCGRRGRYTCRSSPCRLGRSGLDWCGGVVRCVERFRVRVVIRGSIGFGLARALAHPLARTPRRRC